MREQEILNYAIKGINQEIEKHDKSLRQGQKFIEQYYKGEPIKTKLPIYEIENICKKKVEEIENLENKRNELKWILVELEEKEQKK